MRSTDPLLDLRLAQTSRRHWLKRFSAVGAAAFLLPAATRDALAQPVFRVVDQVGRSGTQWA